MPGGDQTGPGGFGPMTGRAAGFCAGMGAAGNPQGGFGRGAHGRGRGWRHQFRATGLTGRQRASAVQPVTAPLPIAPETPQEEVSRTTDIQLLRAQAEAAAAALQEVRRRLDALIAAKQSGGEGPSTAPSDAIP